jgi:indolepyruvate ferredoxin oxidoreductase alpha subunit
MTVATAPPRKPKAERVLLGDEAVAQAALDAGITAAYAYPGTPSTEITEYVLQYAKKHGRPKGGWCANEKTAYEAALGVSMAGRRSLVSMKHVGLNVAADPFVNSAIVKLTGGLVCAVADDPGMHSSQNEQDSRVLVDFARTICLEPSDQQEAYEMTREAFELSEKFHLPVVVRLVTRLAHSRAGVTLRPGVAENPLKKDVPAPAWVLLPAHARRLRKELLRQQPELHEWSETNRWNQLDLSDRDRGLAVITTGIAKNHYLECLPELNYKPSHLHIGSYPLPIGMIRRLAAHSPRIMVLEDGYPFVERRLRGLMPSHLVVEGRGSGKIPEDGELTPDLVRQALDLAPREKIELSGVQLPMRPPQLCTGCPHRDTYSALNIALEGKTDAVVAGDIGCYTLGALPPYRAMESCVCMGASIGMARGAAAAGLGPAIAAIGDSTFLHSGTTGLMDAVAEDANMTVIIFDNDAVAMTGAQDPVLPKSRIEPVVLGLGTDPEHVHVLDAHPTKIEEMAEVMKREIAHEGLSVIIAARPCIPYLQRKKKEEKAENAE